MKTFILLSCYFFLAGCQNERAATKGVTLSPGKEKTPGADVPKEPVTAPSPPPWFVGRWEGVAELRPLAPSLLIDSQERLSARTGKSPSPVALAEVASEDILTLQFRVSEERTVAGESRLESERLILAGVMDEDILRLSLRGPGAHGTLVAKRKGDELLGQLRLAHTKTIRSLDQSEAFVGEVTLKLHK